MSGHLKRLVIPKTWKFGKKVMKWAPKVNCGGYTLEESIPLVILLRDYLKYGDNLSEVKKILKNSNVLVDGKVRKDPKFGLGLMSVLSIPKTDDYFRVILNQRGKFELIKIPKSESDKKICKIVGKKNVRGGKVQLHLHDGRCLLVENNKKYNLSDSLVLELPSQEILDYIPLKANSLALVTHGHNIGIISKFKEIQKIKETSTKIAVLEDKNRGQISTLKDYLFFIGEKKPKITLAM